MKFEKFFNLSLFLYLLGAMVFSNDLKIELTLPNLSVNSTGFTVINKGESFNLKVSVVSDTQEKPSLKIYGLDDFNIYGSGTSQKVSIINNKVLAQTSYNYTLNAPKEGEYIVGPVIVKIGNKEIKSEVIKCLVKSGSVNSKKTGDKSQANEYWCELTAEKKDVFLGEPIVVKSRVLCTNPRAKVVLEAPQMSDFIIKEIPLSQGVRRVKRDLNDYYLFERMFILTPLTIGLKVIPHFRALYKEPASVDKDHRGADDLFNMDPFSFFGPRYKEEIITSDKLELNVRPLPEYAGVVNGVGKFTALNESVDSDQVSVNEPITLTLEVVGEGNFSQMGTPKLELPKFCKYYNSKSDIIPDNKLGLTGGSKKFEYIVQCSKSGLVEIEPQKFTYFDLQDKSYKTLYSQPLNLNVELHDCEIQRDEISQPVDSDNKNNKNDYTQKTQDVLDLQIAESNYDSTRSILVKGFSWYVFIFVFILLALFGGLRFLKNKGYRFFILKYFVLKSESNLFKGRLNKIIENHEIDKLYSFFLDYLAYRFNLSKQGLSQSKLESLLRSASLPQEFVDEFFIYLNKCMSISFSRDEIDEKEKNLILNKANKWFNKFNDKKYSKYF